MKKGFLVVVVCLMTMADFASADLTQVNFSDNFNSGASSLWENQSGTWTAANGVFDSINGSWINTIPYEFTDVTLDVDVNNVADGGIWLRSDGTGRNGILLVTGGWGWAWNGSNPNKPSNAGKNLYWHKVSNGVVGGAYGFVTVGFIPEVSDIHLKVTAVGNTFSAYLNNASTPITTLTTSMFSSGKVGLYDNNRMENFDNFSVQGMANVVPEPISSILFLTGGAILIGRKYLRRKK